MNSSLGLPDLTRTMMFPLTGQGTNFQFVPVGLPTA